MNMDKKKLLYITIGVFSLIFLILIIVLIVVAVQKSDLGSGRSPGEGITPNTPLQSEGVTLEEIHTLESDASLNLETNYDDFINLWCSDASCSDPLTLTLDGGKLSISYHKRTLQVTDIKEKVLLMKDAQNNCAVGKEDVLFITEKGDLYQLDIESILDNGSLQANFVRTMEISSQMNLGLIRINGDIKIKALSTYRSDLRGVSCGLSNPVVYTANKDYRVVDLDAHHILKEYDGHTDFISNSSGPGFLLYADHTISITGNKKLQNQKGANLIYKQVFLFQYREDLKSDFIIVDENNDLYVSTALANTLLSEAKDEVLLYRNDVEYVSHTVDENNDKITQIQILLSNGNTITLTGDLIIK